MRLRLIFTASIISPEREQLYKDRIEDTLTKMPSMPIDIYIVENNGSRKTFLDTIRGVTVVYTDTNSITSFERKGMKEFYDILYVGTKYGFDEEDIVIKLTGLYTLRSSSFINTIFNFMAEYDCFIKCYNVCTREFVKNDCILGLYGLRWKYFEEINYMGMLTHPSMEHVFITEIRAHIEENRIMEVDTLDMYFRGEKNLLL